MKKIFIVSALLLLASCGNLFALTFYDDFMDYAVDSDLNGQGNTGYDWAGDYYRSGTTSMVVREFEGGHNALFRGTANTDYYERDFSSAINSVSSFTIMFNLQTATVANTTYGYIGCGDGSQEAFKIGLKTDASNELHMYQADTTQIDNYGWPLYSYADYTFTLSNINFSTHTFSGMVGINPVDNIPFYQNANSLSWLKFYGNTQGAEVTEGLQITSIDIQGVPEPAAAALFILGILGAGIAGKRARRLLK